MAVNSVRWALCPEVVVSSLIQSCEWAVGFEHMWGPASAPGLGNQGSVGLASQQPAVPAAPRLPDDFSVLDFPDWDGPGGALSPCLHRLL